MNCPECGNEEAVLVCPFGCPEGTVDSDMMICSECQEAVAPELYCPECGDLITLERRREISQQTGAEAWDGGFAENHLMTDADDGFTLPPEPISTATVQPLAAWRFEGFVESDQEFWDMAEALGERMVTRAFKKGIFEGKPAIFSTDGRRF